MNQTATIVRLDEAKTARHLAQASFDLFGDAVENLAFFLTLRPGEFELPSFSSKASMQKYFDIYISEGHKYDIWMKRGAIGPHVRAIRHSDHTPLHILKRSRFYKKIIGVTGCSYGASVMAWRKKSWLATLTAFRTYEQGDFTQADLKKLQDLQPHFESAVKKVAELHESKKGINSLEVFIWGLPMAAVVLSWDLQVLHFNASAQDLCHLWRLGPKGKNLKIAARFVFPGDLATRIRQAKDEIPEVKPTRYNRPKIFPVIRIRHPKVIGLEATVSFLPSQTLSLTRGSFLITFEHQVGLFPLTADNDVILAKLSRREREIAKLAVQGLNAPEIGEKLGTLKTTVRLQFHNIYQKFGIKTRFELMALLQNQRKT